MKNWGARLDDDKLNLGREWILPNPIFNSEFLRMSWICWLNILRWRDSLPIPCSCFNIRVWEYNKCIYLYTQHCLRFVYISLLWNITWHVYCLHIHGMFFPRFIMDLETHLTSSPCLLRLRPKQYLGDQKFGNPNGPNLVRFFVKQNTSNMTERSGDTIEGSVYLSYVFTWTCQMDAKGCHSATP